MQNAYDTANADADMDRRIRERAHAIWERDGRTDGDHEKHWQEARDEIEKQTRDDVGSDLPTSGPSGPATGTQPDGVLPGRGTPADGGDSPPVTERGGKGLSGPR